MKTNRTHSLPSPATRCGMLAALLPLALLVCGCGDASDESSVAQPNAEAPEPSGTWGMGTDGIERPREPGPTWIEPTEIPCPTDGGAWPYNPFQEFLCAAAFLPQNVSELETGVSGVYRLPAYAGRGEDAPPEYAPIPAGEPFTLTIRATLNINHDFAEYGCSVEIDEAEQTVRIHVDAMVDGECEGADEGENREYVLACGIPSLAAGTWTFERTGGPGSMTVELPQTEYGECGD